jgi:hypothetical protein
MIATGCVPSCLAGASQASFVGDPSSGQSEVTVLLLLLLLSDVPAAVIAYQSSPRRWCLLQDPRMHVLGAGMHGTC